MGNAAQRVLTMKIAVDAMGGDHAPEEVVKGALQAAGEGVEVVLVGRRSAIEAELHRGGEPDPRISLVEASDVIGMGEAPAQAVRQKKDSSIMVGMRLLKEGEVAGFVSAGNSGAMVAAALFTLGRLEKIDRPALGTIFSPPPGPVLFLDVGATADCKPFHLLQFAQMGSLYMEKVFGLARPRVGLLSTGEEDSKGNRLAKEAHDLLRKSHLNFVGNLEGRDIPKGVADVVVTDGFTGNVVLKVGEGVSELLINILQQAATNGPHLALALSLLRPTLQTMTKVLDYTEHGGALLLGVRGNVIVGHGRSNAKAIKSAIRTACRAAETGFLDSRLPR